MSKKNNLSKASKYIKVTSLVSFILLGSILFFAGCKKKVTDDRLIVGWQTAWATAGQVMETLIHTNITDLHESNATFRDFLFGPDMLEAGLGGNIDATSLGIVPIINLLATNDDWIVVCRMIDFPVNTMARYGSQINTFSDIKGKKLGVPFGSGGHPYIVLRMEENNLIAGENVDLINVSPTEAVVILQQGGIDALGTWEPTATIIEGKNIGKSIDEKRYPGFITVRKSLVDNYPEKIVALIKSLMDANLYVALNREQTDMWFAKRSGFDLDLLKKIRIIEPNLNAKKIEDISIEISSDDISVSQQVADHMYESGLIKRSIDFNKHVNLELAKKATEEIQKSGSFINQIKLK